MKVLIANTRHFHGGGDSTYAFNLADLLREKKHQVAFFAMSDERNLPDPNADLFVSNIDFRQLNRKKNLLTGFQVLTRAIYSVESLEKFRRMLDRFEPDLVHLQSINGHITPSIIFEAQRKHLPVVWTIHDYGLICPNTHFLVDRSGEICEACCNFAYYHAVLKRCKKNSLLASSVAAVEAYVHQMIGVRERVDAYLAPSIFLRNKLLSRGFRDEKVHLLPLFLPRAKFDFDGRDEGYFLFLGKLDAIKGIYPLLRAARLLPQVRLVLAGPVQEPIASELIELLGPNVQYAGMLRGDPLRELLSNCLALVLPSLWFENQPFSILEAFAAGKPVIASELGGMAELVAPGERGLLVKPGDVDGLAKAMDWIMAHRLESRSMGKNAQNYALAQHSADQHYERLWKVYEEVSCAAGRVVNEAASVPKLLPNIRLD